MSDPRKHRYVRSVEDDRIRYTCGCANEIHVSGVLHCVEKCRTHQKEARSPDALGQWYFEDIGAIKDGIPQCAHYLRELEEALGPFETLFRHENHALEIGPGASMYCPGLLQAGFNYLGIEPSEWAATWTSSTFNVTVTVGTLEDFHQTWDSFALILAAHSLEHMEDAPGAIKKCSDLLVPGGEFWVIVPDDDDPLNPDHLWTFNEFTLAGCLESAGLSIDKLEVRRRIEREQFIYARAVKP